MYCECVIVNVSALVRTVCVCVITICEGVIERERENEDVSVCI